MDVYLPAGSFSSFNSVRIFLRIASGSFFFSGFFFSVISFASFFDSLET